ncbi:MAG: MFS transporter [Oceanicoccus sp.]|uniref:spinster family MFS transporter n=2 Tax=Oceanicoccus sp. TaxID=2691044 RepID=UPI002604DE65|nr:MFS transporter [Oceanicoccus sp.]MDG1772317.1 MFS transporter [Oceanicoccus sp.]
MKNRKAAADAAYAKPLYRGYVLTVLIILYAFNFIDRQLLVILQELIKEDLGLSDTQLGLLSGFTFALFYVVCGIPIARWADRGSRRNIISLAIVIWSAMTAVSGLAQNFVHILLARIGVGVGEAGASPPAHSMISDIFKPEQRATALSLYSMGLYVGILGGFMLGGWVGQYYGWRMAFMVVGLPGVLLAVLVMLTVKEPSRGWSENIAVSDEPPPPFQEVLNLLWSRKAFRHLAFACGLQAMASYSLASWLPSFFLRSTDITIGELGTWLGLAAGIGGGLGTLCGGLLSDRMGQKDPRWYLWIPAIGLLAALPITLYILAFADLMLALMLNFASIFLGSMYLGPVIATTHSMVGVRMRALASAMLFFVLNLVGLGMGPTLVGILSDAMAGTYGIASLGYALLIVATGATLLACTHYLLATRYLKSDLANAPA